MKKPASGTRDILVSPYLRRPLRPLDKVLSEREGQADSCGSPRRAGDGTGKAASATWSLPHKSAAASD